jgi:hypothetical protein
MKRKNPLYLGAICVLGASLAAGAKDNDALGVIARPVESVMTIAPGERGYIPSACASGEVVVGGGPTGIPASVDIAYSSLFTDGVNSGWAVEWKNNGAETVVVSATVTALCAKGTITVAPEAHYPSF